MCQHFGRVPHYLVFTVEDGEITDKELPDNVGHRQFVQQPMSTTIATRADTDSARILEKHARMIVSIKDYEGCTPCETQCPNKAIFMRLRLQGTVSSHGSESGK